MIATLTADQLRAALPSFEATAAIVFHVAERSQDRASARSVATLHQIVAAKHRAPTLGAGKVISDAQLIALIEDLRATNPGSNDFAFVPSALLRATPDSLTWHQPAAKRHMVYIDADRQRQVREVMWPSLVLHAERGDLYCAALATPQRPQPSTTVWHAPLANVAHDGRVCTGNARLPDGWQPSDIEGWNRAWFGSAFTHPNCGRTVRLRGGVPADETKLRDFWMRKPRKRPPSTRALFDTGMTLRAWMERIERTQANAEARP